MAPSHGPEAPPPVPRVSIQAGEVHTSARHVVIRTLLGSCVAVTLFDPERRIGGMNHFMLPHGQSPGRDPSYFGIHAMELLINQLMHLGADRARLVAKVFGAVQVREDSGIAAQNAAFAISFLEDEKIPIAARKLGGVRPLAVQFDTRSGVVRVRTVEGAKDLPDAEVSGRPPDPGPAESTDASVFFFGGAP